MTHPINHHLAQADSYVSQYAEATRISGPVVTGIVVLMIAVVGGVVAVYHLAIKSALGTMFSISENLKETSLNGTKSAEDNRAAAEANARSAEVMVSEAAHARALATELLRRIGQTHTPT